MSTTSLFAAAPEAWPLLRIKHLCQAIGGGTPDTSKKEFWNGDIPWVSPKDMKSPHLVDTEDHITSEGLVNSATQVVPPNAVLIVMRSGILRHSIPVAINDVPVALNQDMRAFLAKQLIAPVYLAYIIQGHQAQLLQAWRKVGATVESLDSELLGNTLIPVPPLPTQLAIADFLDRETGRIDALVAAKERLLDLLAEKRKALIAHAVTRGLDPTVPLRDSGVPWLGKIPGHWEVRRLRFLVQFVSGATPDTGDRNLWDGDIPWVSPKDMKCTKITDSEDHVSEKALSATALRLVAPGSVLVVVRGMILVHSFPVAVNAREVTINQDMKALRCRENLDALFLRDFFRGVENYIVAMADSSAHGTRKLDTHVLGDIEIPVPPLPEQRAIVDHIARETAKIDAVRTATERSIALLKERRAALIAAAVTGQIDVERAA